MRSALLTLALLLIAATALPASASVPTPQVNVGDAITVAGLINSDDYRVEVDPEILRLYGAFFNREPDLGGVQYWIDVSKGKVDGTVYSTLEIAGFFVGASDEFANTYQDAPGNAEFLRHVYNNVLDREPEDEGFNYWLDILNGTNITGGNPGLVKGDRGEVVYYVAVNQEFINRKPYVPGTGNSVTVTGSDQGADALAMQAAFGQFEAETGIAVKYVGSPDVDILRFKPTNLGVFRPHNADLVESLLADGSIKPLPGATEAAVEESWPAAWVDVGRIDGKMVAAPTSADTKSLMWYRPSQFASESWTVPTTSAELRALESAIIAAGETPYCVGIESGPATGWYFTDDLEEEFLRTNGASDYDAWIDHSIPFSDLRVTTAMQTVLDRWNAPNMVFSNTTISETSWSEAITNFEAGNCVMIRQATFTPQLFANPPSLADGSAGAVDVFYNPGITAESRPLIASGSVVAAFDDRPQVWQVLQYMTSASYADRRSAARGFDEWPYISLASGQEGERTAYELNLMSIMANATEVRPDASEVMPVGVGGGTFWTEGTLFVEGSKTAAEAAAAIDASWPG